MNPQTIRGVIKELQNSPDRDERIVGDALVNTTQGVNDDGLKLAIEMSVKSLSSILSGVRKAICRSY